MKKYSSVIGVIFVLAIIVLFTHTVQASSNTGIVIDCTGKSEVEVYLRASEAANLYRTQFDVNYDTDILQVIEIVPGYIGQITAQQTAEGVTQWYNTDGQMAGFQLSRVQDRSLHYECSQVGKGVKVEKNTEVARIKFKVLNNAVSTVVTLSGVVFENVSNTSFTPTEYSLLSESAVRKYSVENTTLTNISGDFVSELNESGYLNVNMTVAKRTYSMEGVGIVVALYDSNNNMKTLTYLNKQMSSDQLEVITIGVDLPENVEGHYLKAYVVSGSITGDPSNRTALSNIVTFPEVNTSTLKGIYTDVRTYSVAENSSTSVTVTAFYSDGSSKDVTSTAVYTSADTATATVSTLGTITGIKAGNTALNISYAGKSIPVPVNINVVAMGTPLLSDIQLAPNLNNINIGKSLKLHMTGINTDRSKTDVSWNTSYTTSDASIATVNSAGEVTGISVGKAVIAATHAGIKKVVVVVVSNVPTLPTTTGIRLDTESYNLDVNEEHITRVSLVYSDKSAQDITALATYTSSNIGIATVNAVGIVTAKAIGETIVSITYGGYTKTANIYVFDPTVARMGSINFDSNMYKVDIAATYKAKILAFYADQKANIITGIVKYTSTDPSVATIDASGIITGVSAGTTVIQSAYGPYTANAKVLVASAGETAAINSIQLDLDAYVVNIGNTHGMSVTASYSNGSITNVTPASTFASSNTSIATVNALGGVVALAAGTTVITAVYGEEKASAIVTVNVPGKVTTSHIKFDASSYSLGIADNRTTVVSKVYSDTSIANLTALCRFVSSNTDIATVNATTGRITGVSNGITVVTAVYGQYVAAATVIVSNIPPTLTAIAVDVSAYSMYMDGSHNTRVTAMWSNDTTIEVTNAATYTSSNTLVATVGNDGVVRPVGGGIANITAHYGGFDSAAEVTVAVMSGIRFYSNPYVVMVNDKRYTVVMAVYSDGSEFVLTTPVGSYTITNNTANISINASGVITAGAGSGSNIGLSATYGSFTANTLVNVITVPTTLLINENFEIGSSFPSNWTLSASWNVQNNISKTLRGNSSAAPNPQVTYNTVTNAGNTGRYKIKLGVQLTSTGAATISNNKILFNYNSGSGGSYYSLEFSNNSDATKNPSLNNIYLKKYVGVNSYNMGTVTLPGGFRGAAFHTIDITYDNGSISVTDTVSGTTTVLFSNIVDTYGTAQLSKSGKIGFTVSNSQTFYDNILVYEF